MSVHETIVPNISLELRLPARFEKKSMPTALGSPDCWRLPCTLFEGNKQIGNPFPTEKEVWEAALIEGLVTDVPVADEEGGQILPKGYHVKPVDEPS